MVKTRLRSFSTSDWMVAVAPIIAVLLAFLVGAVILLALGANPIRAYGAMIDGAFGTQTNIFRVLNRATPLMLIAVGICIAFRAGVINIGAEGQLFIGGVAAAAFALYLGPSLPGILAGPLTLVVGFIGGAVWGGIPGYLKARFQVNEILSTVMMNEIAVQVLLFLLSGPMIDPEQVKQGTRIPQTAMLPQSSWLLQLDSRSQLHIGIFIAIVAAILAYILLWRTTFGYRVRAVGQNRDAALYAGIPIPRYLTLSLVLSGGMAGLAGAVHLAGSEHRMVEGFAVGYGFAGIVVALFGRLHPIGAIPSALLFGALLVGADRMQRAVQVPSATVTVLQGLVVIFVVSSDIWARRWSARRQARAAAAREAAPELAPAASQEAKA
jgi:simple sugar transport system permease protein